MRWPERTNVEAKNVGKQCGVALTKGHRKRWKDSRERFSMVQVAMPEKKKLLCSELRWRGTPENATKRKMRSRRPISPHLNRNISENRGLRSDYREQSRGTKRRVKTVEECGRGKKKIRASAARTSLLKHQGTDDVEGERNARALGWRLNTCSGGRVLKSIGIKSSGKNDKRRPRQLGYHSWKGDLACVQKSETCGSSRRDLRREGRVKVRLERKYVFFFFSPSYLDRPSGKRQELARVGRGTGSVELEKSGGQKLNKSSRENGGAVSPCGSDDVREFAVRNGPQAGVDESRKNPGEKGVKEKVSLGWSKVAEAYS